MIKSVTPDESNDWADCPDPEPRATNCEACGQLLGPYNPNDTSTWRTDNFCSARCKKEANGGET